jgi:hypothetical protein
MAIVQQAPVAYSAYTSLPGTSEQIIQTSAAGVSAGQPAGNFYLNGPASNLINGDPFTVRLAGTILAHGATQIVKIGLLWAAWNAASVSNGVYTPAQVNAATLIDAYQTVGSGALIAGQSYDFLVEQECYASVASGVLNAAGLPTVSVGGVKVNVTNSAPGGPLTCPNMQVAAPSTQPQGITNFVNQPAFSFAASIANSVSDTTESLILTQFCIVLP